MQPDPSGSVAEATAQDTTAEPSTAPDPGPTEDGSPAVESQSDATDAADQPTPGSDDSAEDDGDDEGTEQTEEQRRLSRRERQRLREQERIDKAVADALAESKRQDAEAAETAKREADAQKAREVAAKEFAEYIGEPGETERLKGEIEELNDRVRAEIGTLTEDEFSKIDGQIKAKKARIQDIAKAQSFEGAIRANIWNGIEAHVLSALQFPEMASDQAARSRYLNAEGGIAGALGVLREVVRASAVAEKDAELAALRKAHATDKATWQSELNTWRVRAGAEEVPDTTGGGMAAVADSGALTPERYAAMSFEQRQKLRSTEAGRRQIDEMARRPGFGQRTA